jgi:hypothetical protein
MLIDLDFVDEMNLMIIGVCFLLTISLMLRGRLKVELVGNYVFPRPNQRNIF